MKINTHVKGLDCLAHYYMSVLVIIVTIMYHMETITLKELGIMFHTLHVKLVPLLFLYTILPTYQNEY